MNVNFHVYASAGTFSLEVVRDGYDSEKVYEALRITRRNAGYPGQCLCGWVQAGR